VPSNAISVNVLTPIAWKPAGCARSRSIPIKRPIINETALELPENPLNIKSVIKLFSFLGGMIIVVAIAQKYIGMEGTLVAVFIAALFELHGVALATALLFTQGQFSLADTGLMISLAIIASFISKFVLLWTLGRNKFSAITSLFLAAMLLSGGAAYFALKAFDLG